MPIGKNSIKRVANNGYSSVKSEAPDMENSTVIANPSLEVVEKMLPKADAPKPASKKTGANSAPKAKPTATKKPASSTATKKPASTTAKKSAEAKETAEEKSFVNVGKELPVYLL